MNGVNLAFQECASHGDFRDCLRLLLETGVKSLGLYHYFDAALPKLQQATHNLPNVFLNYDGAAFNVKDLAQGLSE